MSAGISLAPTAASFSELLGVRCLSQPEQLAPYEVPERGPRGYTHCVLKPETEAEVAAILAIANRETAPLVLSAGRTGLVEAQRPEGETVLSLERLAAPIAFELADGRRFEFPTGIKAEAAVDALSAWWLSCGRPSTADARIEVQAGISVDAVNALLAPLGLMWPMEMGSSSAASVGACAANGSAGANAVCYGTAAHMTEWARGYWADGTAAGPCAGLCWQGVVPSRVAIDSAAVDPANGLIGTQGVLGIITRLRLRCFPVPAQREAVLLALPDMTAAMRVLAGAREEFGAAVEEFEFISSAAMGLVRAHLGEAFRSPLGERDSPYFGLLQVKSDDADEDLAGRLYSLVAEHLAMPEDDIGYAPLKALKTLRHSITEASNARSRELGGGRLSFDTATPVDRCGAYLDALVGAVREQSPATLVVAFGHAGVGGAHIHLLGTREQPIAAQSRELIQLVFDVTADFGGTFSAEHGVGPKWSGEFKRRAPPAVVAALRVAKRAHDPRGILNPRSFGLLRDE